MQWIAPSEKDTGTETLEKRLWAAADELRANSGLTSAQYSQPVLGLIFLRFAEVRFFAQLAVLEKQAAGGRRGSRVDDPTAYQAEGILYLTPPARFDHILRLPEGSDVGKAVNEAMRDIEAKNPQLAGILPKTYQIFDSTLLKNLLKKVSEIPPTAEGDTFGRVYEYFLGEFARTEGSRGARAELATEGPSAGAGATGDRGYARRRAPAQLHARDLSGQSRCPLRACVRDVQGSHKRRRELVGVSPHETETIVR